MPVSSTRQPVSAQEVFNAFCPSFAWSPDNPECQVVRDVYVGKRRKPRHFRVVSPRATGLTAEELRQLFHADMHVEAKPFSHRYFEDKTGEGIYSSLDLSRRFEEPSGLGRTDQGAVYTLIAQDLAGNIVGFIECTLSVFVGEYCGPSGEALALDCVPFNNRHYDLGFGFKFGYAYTMAKYRGRGVMAALLDAFCEAYIEELRNIADALEPLARRRRRSFVAGSRLSAQWLSLSGKMASYKLLDHLDEIHLALPDLVGWPGVLVITETNCGEVGW